MFRPLPDDESEQEPPTRVEVDGEVFDVVAPQQTGSVPLRMVSGLWAQPWLWVRFRKLRWSGNEQRDIEASIQNFLARSIPRWATSSRHAVMPRQHFSSVPSPAHGTDDMHTREVADIWTQE
jgi:hypothetical protein